MTPERILVVEWPNSAMSVEEVDSEAPSRPGVMKREYVRADIFVRVLRDAIHATEIARQELLLEQFLMKPFTILLLLSLTFFAASTCVGVVEDVVYEFR